MNIHDYLKYYREQNGLTQEQLAEKLFVTRQAVSKWERGESYPEIETIIELSNIYDVSIDELLRGIKYLQKPFTVGEENIWWKIILSLIFSLFFALFVTNETWTFIALLLLQIYVFVNQFKEGKITVGRKGVRIQYYETFVHRFISIFNPERYTAFVLYEDVDLLRIEYIPRKRYGYADFMPDIFRICLILTNGKLIYVKMSMKLQDNLPLLVDYFESKGVLVKDYYQVVEMLLNGVNVYEGVHEKTKLS